MQAYLKAYQQKTSLYNIARDYEKDSINLIIYKTETETQEVKTLQTPKTLHSGTCITQLPNGKLFCFGDDYPYSGATVLIDVNGGVEVLPSGTPCRCSSCIYFNSSVYCFGRKTWNDCLTLSRRFDLNQNRWIQLTPMPKADCMCNSIIFNGNILISGYVTRNLLLYSIDIDSFSTIPCEFKREIKILINAERLYLIECPGSIYESEIGSYSNWRRIGKSRVGHFMQVYCSYNKGGIYISTIYGSDMQYYYFNLHQKITIDFAYYNEHVSLRRVGKKIEAIKWMNQNFKLGPYYLDEWNLKGGTLNILGENLEAIECCEEEIKSNPNNPDFYNEKGNVFYELKRYLEAIECYDKAIKLNPRNHNFYNNKGKAFCDLQKYLEAIECYDKAIKLDPSNIYLYNNKAKAFYNLKRYLEAIECYDKAIKLDPNDADFYWKKGYVLNELGSYPEAVESYNKAIKINSNIAKFHNDKGNTLFALERYQEAIQCYDEESNFSLKILCIFAAELEY
ncbi:unnamed protein product [Blepharisma stoltei]|uniref:Tetratricopeptide repeat protein n=1 Tax=Blepharisma stoltei TaxID=1481888 RepID=A0AAU9JYN2_9CILI|nr:unnamed protein product [Blepharisma stoltei]